MIITNEDILVLRDIQGLIESNIDRDYQDDDKETMELLDKFNCLVDKIASKKKEHASKQNAWNKENREYHRITNKITYYKSKHDSEKVEYWRNKLEEYKGAN